MNKWAFLPDFMKSQKTSFAHACWLTNQPWNNISLAKVLIVKQVENRNRVCTWGVMKKAQKRSNRWYNGFRYQRGLLLIFHYWTFTSWLKTEIFNLRNAATVTKHVQCLTSLFDMGLRHLTTDYERELYLLCLCSIKRNGTFITDPLQKHTIELSYNLVPRLKPSWTAHNLTTTTCYNRLNPKSCKVSAGLKDKPKQPSIEVKRKHLRCWATKPAKHKTRQI